MIPSKHTYTKNGQTHISTDYIKFLYGNELVIDVTEGGLISGPSLAEGGITLAGLTPDAEVYIVGQVEGWMFLTNAFAWHENQEAITSMARHYSLADQLFFPYLVPEHINVIKVEPRQVEAQMITPLLLYGTNRIAMIPKAPTRKNLTFLDTINRAAWLTHVIEKQPVGTLRESALLAKFGPSGQN